MRDGCRKEIQSVTSSAAVNILISTVIDQYPVGVLYQDCQQQPTHYGPRSK